MARRRRWWWIATLTLPIAAATGLYAIAQTAPTTQPKPQDPYERLLGGDANRGGEKPLQPSGRPTPDKTTGAGAVAPGAPQLQTQREGTFVVDRIGRIMRSNDGQNWEFTFDSDGSAMQDPPVRVLPNLKLMVMEDAIESRPRELRFRVTGMLTEYRGRNHILLEKVVVVQDAK
jgi:hypothetical protein